MDELLNALLDAACDFFGIDPQRGRGPALLRWIFHFLLKLMLFLFGILIAIMSLLRFRRTRRHRWIPVLLLIVVLAVAAILLWLYIR